MKHLFDLFEKFPDGSSLWQDSVPGLGKTYLRLQELAKRSDNEFYAINLTSGEVLAFPLERSMQGSAKLHSLKKPASVQAARP